MAVGLNLGLLVLAARGRAVISLPLLFLPFLVLALVLFVLLGGVFLQDRSIIQGSSHSHWLTSRRPEIVVATTRTAR